VAERICKADFFSGSENYEKLDEYSVINLVPQDIQLFNECSK